MVLILLWHFCDHSLSPNGVEKFISALKAISYSQSQVFPLWLLNPNMDPLSLLIVVCVAKCVYSPGSSTKLLIASTWDVVSPDKKKRRKKRKKFI